MLSIHWKTTYFQMIKSYIKNPVFRFHVAFCFRQAEGLVSLLRKVLWLFNHMKRSIVLHPNMKVSYGLYIGHGGPIVVNLTAIIGNNKNLS